MRRAGPPFHRDNNGALHWAATAKRLRAELADAGREVAEAERRRAVLRQELSVAEEMLGRAACLPLVAREDIQGLPVRRTTREINGPPPFIPHAEPDEYEAEKGGVVVEFRPK
jgi:hypothetical protein